MKKSRPKLGDYVLATRYSDGDPKDPWCVGFVAGIYVQIKSGVINGQPRFEVVDREGVTFLCNGFRRVEKITPEIGSWLIDNIEEIELSGRSMWYFLKSEKLKTVN